MREQNIMERLQKDVEIPDIVWRKANQSFDKIKAEQAAKSGRIVKLEGGSSRHCVSARRLAILAAAICTMGVVTAGAAAYVQWSHGLEKELHISEDQKAKLSDSTLVDSPALTATNDGVTITLEQSIVDNYCGYLSFRVEGYDVPEGEQPDFETVGIDLDCSGTSMYDYGFYDGTILGENGRYVYEDGSPLQWDEEEQIIVNYELEDGSLEYRVHLFATDDEEGGFAGKQIHIDLSNLGIYQEDNTVNVAVEGTWSFDWILQASEDIQTYELKAELGDSGATVTGVEITPITMKIVYDYDRQIVTEPAINEATGEEQETRFYKEPPRCTGVRLKDGTLLTHVFTGGSTSGYVDSESSVYQMIIGANRILDVEEIDALLFVKSDPEENGGVYTEEHLYLVPIQ